MPRRAQANRKANIWVARAVPLFLLAIIGYSSWVLTKLVCLDYLIKPPPSLNIPSRKGAAIAILVTFYILLFITLITYARLIDTVTRTPGLVPRGPHWNVEKRRRLEEKRGRRSSRGRRNTTREKSVDGGNNAFEISKETDDIASDHLPFKVEDFWKREVFVCNYDGRPPFCSTCYNWKPDRAHHCSELDRCVMKMDHFCPWVGGVVSETSFKFFIQFTFYAAIFCTHILVVMAYYFAQRQKEDNYLNVHWIMIIAISALFLLFSAGMCLSSGQFAFINSTTIENLSRKQKVWYLAIFISPQALQEAEHRGVPLRTISYPRPPEEQLQILEQNGATAPGSATSATERNSGANIQAGDYRTFVILETIPGQNPFNIGLLGNFQDIMGETIWDWLMPYKRSPCVIHDDPASLYKLGNVVPNLKHSIGLTSWNEEFSGRRRKHSRRRRQSQTRSKG